MHIGKAEPRRDPLLSTAIVAKWLGVSARTICFWAECGEIPAMKIGRHWRFREEELRRWLEGAQARIVPLQVVKRSVG